MTYPTGSQIPRLASIARGNAPGRAVPAIRARHALLGVLVLSAGTLLGCSKEEGAASPEPAATATAAPVPSRAPSPTPTAATRTPDTTTPSTPTGAPVSRATAAPRATARPQVASIDAETAARICEQAGLPGPPSPDRHSPEMMAVIYDAIARVGDQASAEAVGEVGALYFAVMQNREDSDLARAWLEKAKELAPQAYEWPHLLGRLFLLRQSTERARLEFQRSAELNPDYIGNYSWLGELELSREDGELAAKHFQEYVQRAPEVVYGYAGLANAALLRGDLDQALALLNKAQTINPNDARVHLAFAQYYDLKGEKRLAAMHQGVGQRVARIPQPLSIDPLDLFMAKVTGPTQRSLNSVASYYGAGDTESGDLLANALLAEYPESPRLLAGVAELYLRLNRHEQAEKLARRALEIDPRHTTAAVVASDAVAAQGDNEEGLRFAERALATDPSMTAAHVARSRRLMALDRGDDALAAMKQAVETDPDNFKIRTFVGEMLLRRDAHAEADAWADDIIQRGEAQREIPQAVATAYGVKASVALKQEQPEQAAQLLVKALEIDPTLEGYFQQLIALVREHAGVEDALRICRRFMDEHPSLIGYAIAYADLLVAAGRPEDAITHLQWLSKDLAIHPLPHYALARVLRIQGRYDEARTAIDKAIGLEPGNERSHLLRLELGILEEDPAATLAAAEAGLEQRPESLQLQNGLAWVLATTADADLRDPPRAVTLAEEINRRTDRQVFNYLDTLACAYAAAGAFDRAVQVEQEAIDLAEKEGATESAEQFTERRELFKQQKPYVENR